MADLHDAAYSKKHMYFAFSQDAVEYLRKNDRKLLERLWPRIVCFGRMTPNGKADVVRRWQARDIVVGMVGDGENDAAALRAAHVGVCINCGNDASVVAPFASP